ncbi:MAG: hypothetical protein Q7S40_09165 [Opitutaceae bacterium]|nr:hypothetical protein [Opitutaceae bacterium]
MTSSRFVEPSPVVELHLPDGRTLQGPRGATAGELLEPVRSQLAAPLVGVIVNGELQELTYPITMEARVRPVTMSDVDGARIYRRSLTFLLQAAFGGLFGAASLNIDHALTSGGYFCNVAGRPPLTPGEIAALEAEMRRLVALDLPFTRREVPVAEAITHFEKRGFHDKAQLLSHRTKSMLTLYQLGEHLERLLAGEQVQLPRYNFQAGRQEPGEIIRLQAGQLIILEGIHGLNPRLIPPALAAQSFQVYASALTQLNIDRHNRVATTDTRLIRRIVRDARDRGYNATQTISRWESVRRGEKLHIFPYQENAHVMFNSALVYELSALRPLVEPLLRQVPPGTLEYMESSRLLAFLEWFLPIETEWVPDNSILREFIGGSILKDFKVWGV